MPLERRHVLAGSVAYSVPFLSSLGALPLRFGFGGATIAWLGSDGSPAGCAQATVTIGGGGTMQLRSEPAITWETLGVPPHTIVSTVQLVSWKHRLAATVGGVNSVFAFQVVSDVDGLAVHDGYAGGSGPFLDIFQIVSPIEGAWVTENEIAFAVLPQYSASNARIRLKAWFIIDPAENALDWRLDEINLSIAHGGHTRPMMSRKGL